MDGNDVQPGSNQVSPLTAEGSEFLQDLLDRDVTEAQDPFGEGLSPVEIARFRLLASTFQGAGNDNQTLGVHDANLIFSNRSVLNLGTREVYGLVDAGLARVSFENTPLWHWLTSMDGLDGPYLSFRTLHGEADIRAGALTVLKLLRAPVNIRAPFDRNTCLDSWFAEDADTRVRVAALAYLGECGLSADLPAIKRELDRGDYQTRSAAIDATLRIILRDSREGAILALYEMQPENVGKELVRSLFEHAGAISDEVIAQGISHRNSDVRRVVAKILRERSALDAETATRLLSDDDNSVRFEAMKALIELGKQFSSKEAKELLVRPQGLGLLGSYDPVGENYLTEFQEMQMRRLAENDLERIVTESSLLNRTPYFIQVERRPSQHIEALRQHVDDQFKGEFERQVQDWTRRYGAEFAEETKPTETFLRKKLTRRGLDVIGSLRDPNDLIRIRNALRSGFVEYSDTDSEYLRANGEWEDIQLIANAIRERPMASGADSSRIHLAARAIYQIGRARLNELLTMDIPGPLKSQVVVHTPDTAFKALGNEAILPLFGNEDEKVRRVVTLKCVRALPKARVETLLAAYLSQETYYYNVVHWLDFGVSLSRTQAGASAKRALAQQ